MRPVFRRYLRNNSGSLAILAAIRLTSSLLMPINLPYLARCVPKHRPSSSSLVVCHLAVLPGGVNTMKARVARTSFSLFFLLSVFAPVHAQAASGQPTEPPSRLSMLVHDFSTWLNHVTGTRASNPQAGRNSPPLPRPRPAAEPAPGPVASNKEWSEFVPPSGASKKKTPAPVQIND